MTAPRTAIVVGGGVFGATGALELNARGWQVTLLDPAPLPHADASSTDVSKVIRMDYGSDVFYHELGERSLEGWDRWNRDWPRPLYHETGFLILAPTLMAPGGFEFESYQALEARGHAPIRLGELDVERTAHWNLDGYPDGYFNPRAGWAESGAVVERLLAMAATGGVEIRQAAVESLRSAGSRVAGVRTVDGQDLEADAVVVAAGAWTPRLLPWLSDRAWPTGHPVLHFQVDDAQAFAGTRFTAWAADISNTGWYGFPALPDGRLKIANHGVGRRVQPGERGSVDAAQEAHARRFLRRALPALADRPVVYRRICMYCDTFDGDFLIAADPDRPGLVVATGGSGHGFKFAPLLGGMIADATEGESGAWSERFGWRELGTLRAEEARYTGD